MNAERLCLGAAEGEVSTYRTLLRGAYTDPGTGEVFHFVYQTTEAPEVFLENRGLMRQVSAELFSARGMELLSFQLAVESRETLNTDEILGRNGFAGSVIPFPCTAADPS